MNDHDIKKLIEVYKQLRDSHEKDFPNHKDYSCLERIDKIIKSLEDLLTKEYSHE